MTTFPIEVRSATKNSTDFVGGCRAKEFEHFPEGARSIRLVALTIAAEGGKADIAKPLKGFGSGFMVIALPYSGNAFRVVYSVRIGEGLWVVHASQEKSTQRIKTPKHDIQASGALRWPSAGLS